MKSHLLAIVVLVAIAAGIMSPTAQAQYPKNVLIEQFTSATCGPCVPASPVMQRVMDVGKGTFVVKYHLNFPAPNDPLYLNAPQANAARQTAYQVGGIPTARIMGSTTTDPRNEAAVNSAVTNAKAQMSSISLKVVDDKNAKKARVRVFSPSGVSGQRLFVAIVNRHVVLPNLPQTLPGSNGMTDFYDAFLGFLTDNGGQQITVPANTSQEFEFSYNLGSSDVWTGEKYLMAWIQSGQNGAILQANVSRDSEDSTKLQFLNRSSVSAVVDGPLYDRIPRGGTKTRQITLRNSGGSNVSVSFELVNQGSVSQSGFNVVVPQPVTLPPGETTTVEVSIQAPANRSVFSPFEVRMIASDGEMGAPRVFNFLVDGTKIALYTGTYSSANHISTFVSSLGLVQDRLADLAVIPHGAEANAAYPITDFEGAVYFINGNAAVGYLAAGGVLNQVKAMLNAGKSVYLTAELEMTANFHPQSQITNFEAQAFYTNTLGLQWAQIIGNYSQNGNQITIRPFQVAGVAGDPVGGGLSLDGHSQVNVNAGTYQLEMDGYRLVGNTSTACLTSGGFTVMSKYISPSNGRLVYSSLGFAGLNNEQQRSQLVKRVFDWLFPQVAPQITLSASQVNFGTIFVNTTREREIVVTNSGLAPLEITGVTISGGQSNAFAITEGGASGTPITVQPNGTHRIKINFQPTSAGDKQSSLVINSNASPTATQVDLRGRADLENSVATDVTSETGAIGLRLVGANPVTTQSGIELNVRGSEAVTVSVVDATGRTVRTLFDGASAERTLLTVDAAELNNGLYTIVATNGSERAVLTVVVAR